MVSGGSALPTHIDSFFDMIHVNVIAGYGLTETAPTLLNRPVERNVLGTVGVPPPGTTPSSSLTYSPSHVYPLLIYSLSLIYSPSLIPTQHTTSHTPSNTPSHTFPHTLTHILFHTLLLSHTRHYYQNS